MKVVDVKTPKFFDQSLAHKIERFCAETITARTTKLWRNYSPASLNIKGHLIFSALIEDEKILAFSGIYNGGRYPEGVYRILNRMFVSPSFRRKHFISARSPWRPFALVNHQLSIVMDCLDIAFVSFEDDKRARVLPAVCEHIESIQKDAWTYDTRRFQVAPGNDKPCYQLVAWANITRKFQEFPLESINTERYNLL